MASNLYDYNHPLSDFTGGFDIVQFDGEVKADATVVAGSEACYGISLQSGVVSVHFNSEPPQGTKDAVNDLISAHVPA